MSDRMKYKVYILAYQGDACDKLLGGAFIAEGDAVAYAIHRAHTIPDGKTHVFEVETSKGQHVYRAG